MSEHKPARLHHFLNENSCRCKSSVSDFTVNVQWSKGVTCTSLGPEPTVFPVPPQSFFGLKWFVVSEKVGRWGASCVSNDSTSLTGQHTGWKNIQSRAQQQEHRQTAAGAPSLWTVLGFLYSSKLVPGNLGATNRPILFRPNEQSAYLMAAVA